MFILYCFVFPIFLSPISNANKCHLSAGGDRLDVNNPETWKCFADEELHQFKHTVPFDQVYTKVARPKNVIIFIGDGLSLSTVTGARYLKATTRNKDAGEELLSWETWPSVSLLRTMDADRMTTDSAAAATALFTGTKGIHYTLGLTKGAGCCSCDVINQTHYAQSVLLLAQKQGLSTGIVTTTRVTHATPAATYAISPNRNWEASVDSAAQQNQTGKSQHCQDIAQQLIDIGIDFNVVLGGGTEMFHGPATTYSATKSGKRKDGKDLLSKWAERQKQKNRRFSLVTNKTQFDAVDVNQTDYLLGVLASSNMDYEIDRTDQPSLAEMTAKAVSILQRNPKGFLLMVEGGRIDHGHHMNQAKYALTETLALEEAVDVAIKLTKSDETMVVLTADHSHAYHVVGYATRNQSVLGVDNTAQGEDKLPYLISTYTNGPGAQINKSRPNPLDTGDLFQTSYRQQSLVPLGISTHEAEDVPLYATGPYSHLFRRSTDNTYLTYATMFALCLGQYENETHCNSGFTLVIGRGSYLFPIISIIFTYFVQNH